MENMKNIRLNKINNVIVIDKKAVYVCFKFVNNSHKFIQDLFTELNLFRVLNKIGA